MSPTVTQVSCCPQRSGIAVNLAGHSVHSGFDVVQAFLAASSHVTHMAELRDLITASCKELGFDFFAIVHHINFGRPSTDKVRLSNYPIDVIAKFRVAANLREPVLAAAERTASGFLWSNLGKLVRLGPKDMQYMKSAARYGLAEGFTVPNHVPGETFGSCHFAVRRKDALPVENLPAAQALGTFAFERARQLLCDAQPSEQYVVPAPLTSRQRDCLLFAARGKSDSVIADLLNIRPRTVNEHIEAAKRRYSVATRTQLIVRALFRSEICFTEVLD